MAYYEDNSISHDITTDAGFRAWAQKIHDGLIAAGLIQTSDTGQANLTTFTTPATNNTYSGYEIFRFDDAAQSTDPIFLKVEYGRAGGASRPSLRITGSTSTDGAGTPSGVVGTVWSLTPNVNPSGNGRIHIALVDGALILISAPDTSSTAKMIFMLDRLRDIDGNLSFTGWGTWGFASTSAGNTYNVIRLGRSFSPACVGVSGSVVAGGVLLAGYFRPVLPCSALRSMLAAIGGEIASGDTGTITIDGVARTYKRLQLTGNGLAIASSAGSNATVNHDILVPYE